MPEEINDSVNVLFIHRFECPDCGQIHRADRVVRCFKCGTETEHQEKVGEITL